MNTYNTTFENGADLKKANELLSSRLEDFNLWMDNSEAITLANGCEIGSINDLGLDIETVFSDDDDHDSELQYIRFLLSWGGPSDEIRFYPNGKIEYVYLDWFCGAGFDLTDNKEFQFIKDYFGIDDLIYQEV